MSFFKKKKLFITIFVTLIILILFKNYQNRELILFCKFSKNHDDFIKKKSSLVDFPKEFLIFFQKGRIFANFYPTITTKFINYDFSASAQKKVKEKKLILSYSVKNDNGEFLLTTYAPWPDQDPKYQEHYDDIDFPYRVLHLEKDTLDLKLGHTENVTVAYCEVF